MDVRQKQRLFKTVLLNPQLARSRFLPTSTPPFDAFDVAAIRAMITKVRVGFDLV